MLLPLRLSASEGDSVDDNPNLADARMGATASASSVSKLSPFSFVPTRVFGDNMNIQLGNRYGDPRGLAGNQFSGRENRG